MTILPPPPLRRWRRTGTPSACSRPRRSATSSGASSAGVAAPAAGARASAAPACQPLLDRALGLADIEAVGDHQGRQGLLIAGMREHQQRPRVARGQP